ncbi:TetR/AcrR family transcriptional regulator [Lutimaribacter marinistellae]|uniref:TetR/AcrR family transcriptional regulator n=1 Tax=Lutimaribacter marinistellae TaxID=1820329 RepID=A0ABV7TEZ9_9RHOB
MSQQPNPRERYLAIATSAFAETGYHGVSLARLAETAGVTKQALLHFFGTKERLYTEILTALAQRLSAKIDEIEAPDAETRLVAYFDAHAAGALSQPDDAKLVIRALLDSDAAARIWPMKPYLEKLVNLALLTRRWRGADKREVLAGLYQLIGSIQYFAISNPTLTGMYGDTASTTLAEHVTRNVHDAVKLFAYGEKID